MKKIKIRFLISYILDYGDFIQFFKPYIAPVTDTLIILMYDTWLVRATSETLASNVNIFEFIILVPIFNVMNA